MIGNAKSFNEARHFGKFTEIQHFTYHHPQKIRHWILSQASSIQFTSAHQTFLKIRFSPSSLHSCILHMHDIMRPRLFRSFLLPHSRFNNPNVYIVNLGPLEYCSYASDCGSRHRSMQVIFCAIRLCTKRDRSVIKIIPPTTHTCFINCNREKVFDYWQLKKKKKKKKKREKINK